MKSTCPIDFKLDKCSSKDYGLTCETCYHMECVVCNNKSQYFLIHKDTKKQYPICKVCADKGWYNKDIFDLN